MTDTDKEKLKEAVLVNLRSVTQSAKGGVLLSRLQEDYRNLIGTVIPFQPLGYSKLEQFLDDIPQVVQIKRKTDGQLYVEAVINATTAHLASLISKQKGASAKSSSVSKKRTRSHAWKTAGNNKPGSSSDEKDKIIEDLRNALGREKKLVKDYSSQIIRLNSIIASGQDTLALEQGKVRELEYQLQVSKKNEERVANLKEDTGVYIKTINNLKSKLLEQEDINKRLVTQVKSLSCVHLSRLKDEQSVLLLLKNEVDLIKNLPCLLSDSRVYLSLSSINNTICQRIKRLNEHEVSMEMKGKPAENPSNDSTADDNNNYSNLLNLYNEQSEKIKNLETQLEEQNCLMESFADKYEKQFKSMEYNINIQWNKRFQKMDTKVNKESQKFNEMKNTIEQLTNYFKSLVLNQEETKHQGNHSQTVPEAENGESDIEEESSEISSVSFDYTAKKKKKRKKAKEVAQSTTVVYVPPHRRT